MDLIFVIIQCEGTENIAQAPITFPQIGIATFWTKRDDSKTLSAKLCLIPIMHITALTCNISIVDNLQLWIDYIYVKHCIS